MPTPAHFASIQPTSETRPFLKEKGLTPIELSSWHLLRSLSGKPPAPDLHLQGADKRHAYIKYSKAENPERYIVLCTLMLLTFVELPLWCDRQKVQCSPEEGMQIYLSPLPYLPVIVSVPVEIICYVALLWLGVLEHNSLPSRSHHTTGSVLRIVLPLVSISEAFVFMLRPLPFRFAPLARAILACLTEPVFSSLQSTMQIIPALSTVLTLLVSTTLFFGWVFAMLLDDLPGVNPRCEVLAKDADSLSECKASNDGFATLPEALYTTLFASTTTTLPDAALPSMASNPSLLPLWIGFYLIVPFLFLNLALAVVYNSYTETLKAKVQMYFSNRKAGLRLAFEAITTESRGISLPTLETLVSVVNDSELVSYIPPLHIRYLFIKLDKDGSGHIDLAEFYELCNTLRLEYVRVPTRSYFQRMYAEIWERYSMSIIKVWVVDELPHVVTAILLLNSLCIFLESLQDLTNSEMFLAADTWGYIELGFSLLYALEAVAKLTVIPWEKYKHSKTNLFDLTVTVLLLTTSLVWLSPVPLSSEVVRIFTILRLLRLLELVSKTETFGFTFSCINDMVAGSLPVILSLFLTNSIFAIIGSQIYGGLIYASNELLVDAEIFKSDMDSLQMNDFTSAHVMLLSLLVSGGPLKDIVEAYQVVGGKWGAGVFFFVHYYAVVLIMFNVFVSFIIDAFLSRFMVKDDNFETAGFERTSEERGEEVVEEEGYEVLVKEYMGVEGIYTALYAND